MDKLKMHSPDLTQANLAKLRELFPGCVTEATGPDGAMSFAVDTDLLRQELAGFVVEGPQERYRLDWPGKREALLASNAPVGKTLRPVVDRSVDFQSTSNIFIEGDNLEALKLLRETYLGKVKMIFIDPPYNTGNDFVYDDDFAEDTQQFLRRSLQRDEAGNRLVANTEANGRFHSDWLSMMYSRLRVARDFLREDGVMFVAIDDSEQHNLLSLCSEIFGRENHVATIIWQHSIQPKGYTDVFSVHHNYLLMFQKSAEFQLQPLERTDEDNKAYANPDNDPKGPWRAGDVRNALLRPNLRYALRTPSGKTIQPPENGWRWKKETMQEKIDSGEVVFRDDETRVMRKIYLESLEGRAPETIWFGKDAGTTRDGARELKDDFGGEAPFDTVKPTALVARMARIAGVSDDDLVMDFFAGSGTTGVSCLDAGAGRFLLVQLAERIDTTTPHGKVAQSLGLLTVADVASARLATACQRAGSSRGRSGFRYFRIDTSNFADVYYDPDSIKKDSLDLFVDNVKPDRSAEDLLFQVMLSWGVDLALPIEKQSIKGKDVFLVDGNALAACFDASGGVDEAFVKELAKLKPLRVVFRDAGFKSDDVKTNVEQVFKLLSPSTDVRTI